MANTAVLTELSSGGAVSTPSRNYAKKVVKRSEHVQVRNIIIGEQHSKSKATVTKRKTILSGKQKVIDGKHVLMTSEILSGLEEAENITNKRKTAGAKNGKRRAHKVIEESSEESEVSLDESLDILDCIVVES